MATKQDKKSRLKSRVTHPKRQMARKMMLFVSFIFFPVTVFYFSPYLSIAGPAMGIISGAIVMFGALTIFSLFFGRIFCSWFCPMGGMQDAMATIRNRRIKRKSFWVKWLIFIPWISVLLVLPMILIPGWGGFDFFWRIGGSFVVLDDPLTIVDITGISILSIQGILIYYIVIVALLILGFAIGKRSFCHHMCWIGPFMIIGRKLSQWLRIPGLRLKPENEKCIDCKRCDRTCPMSLEVSELVQKGDMDDTNCILCGECIDACPKNVIHYKFTTYPRATVPEVKTEED